MGYKYMKKISIVILISIVFSNLSFATEISKGKIIESFDEISCISQSHMKLALDYQDKYIFKSKDSMDMARYRGSMSNLNCKSITEGMDLKVVRTILLDKQLAEKKQIVLVKLPDGFTIWIAR